MVNHLNFTKFNGCPRQAYLTEHTKAHMSNRDKNFLSSHLRDIQRDMLRSFPPGVTVYGDLKHAAADTREIIKQGEKVIYGATFMTDGAAARCDVIMLENGRYDIYAVRPTNRYTRWIDEVLFAKIIMEKAGIPTGRAYVCAIDKEGDKKSSLTIVDVSNHKREARLRDKLDSILFYTRSKEEPKALLTKQCGACPYLGMCFATDEDSIFSLKSLPFSKKMSLYRQGIKTVDDYTACSDTDEHVMREIMVRKTDEDVYNVGEIRGFLSTLSYPLGFLDFETMEVFHPNDEVLAPMDTVITQFSYHLIERKGAEPVHYEFIGDGISYCEREAARKLCECIKPDHTVLMYSDYEKICLERVIRRLPEYKKPLEAIIANLVDLEKPFAKKFLANRRMDGKSSLKKVLPALYPSSPELDYSAMRIQNGQQAESVYARLCKMPPHEREKAICDLKEYCALDTLAMIKLWEKLEYYGEIG